MLSCDAKNFSTAIIFEMWRIRLISELSPFFLCAFWKSPRNFWSNVGKNVPLGFQISHLHRVPNFRHRQDKRQHVASLFTTNMAAQAGPSRIRYMSAHLLGPDTRPPAGREEVDLSNLVAQLSIQDIDELETQIRNGSQMSDADLALSIFAEDA